MTARPWKPGWNPGLAVERGMSVEPTAVEGAMASALAGAAVDTVTNTKATPASAAAARLGVADAGQPDQEDQHDREGCLVSLHVHSTGPTGTCIHPAGQRVSSIGFVPRTRFVNSV